MSDTTARHRLTDSKRWDMTSIVDLAKQLGVNMDRLKAMQWIVAVSNAERESFALDLPTGVFGAGVSLVDFDPDDLDDFRGLAQRVRAAGRPNVESAIAIAGSAAQGKAQAFPGDFDFFERVNIRTPTLPEARVVLREVLRETALRAHDEADMALIEVNFGVYPCPVIERGLTRATGDPITWLPADVARGSIAVVTATGEPLTIDWHAVESGSGWTYVGWIVVDEASGRIALASNMMDVTWETPSGVLVPLDGSIDPFLQEVYLELDSIPLFLKVARWIGSDATAAYVANMRQQVQHYVHTDPNFCKASKRLYNLFRMTNELGAAAYVRELFDQPEAQMYEVPGLLEAADAALHRTTKVDRELIVRQLDRVVHTVVSAAGGVAVADLVLELIRLRDIVTGRLPDDHAWDGMLAKTRERCMEIVSEYFRVRLLGLPRIVTLVEELRC